MIMKNSTKNLRFVYNDKIGDTHYPHYDIYSYDVLIGIFYEGTKHLCVNDSYIDFSRTTNIHYKIMVGWCIYYFGLPIMKTPNEWQAIKCNAPSIYYIRKLTPETRKICGINIDTF